MANSKTRICTTCGKEYNYCPHCGGDKYKPRWLMAYCSEGCKDIFLTIADYNAKTITIEEAQNRIANYSIDTFARESIKNVYNEIKGHSSIPVVVEAPVPVVEEASIVVETPVVEEVHKEISEEVSNSFEQPTPYFKKKKKSYFPTEE